MKKIAVVEDHPDNRLLAEAILGEEFELSLYTDGPAALEGMAGNLPDLVLLDISLPGMDGVEVLRRIRTGATSSNLPVIALTANAMAGDRAKYLSLGFDDYVSKPITDDLAFVDLVRSHLR